MRMQRFWPALVLAATVAACGDDDGVQEPDTNATLTEQEAEDVAEAVAAQVYVDMDAEFRVPTFDPTAPVQSPGEATDLMTRTFEFTRPCPRGGSVTFAGTSTAEINREEQHVILDTEATRTHEDCVLRMRRHGLIELDGAPNIALDAHFERQFGMPLGPQTVSIEGAVDWAILETDRSGTCEIQLDVVWERTLESGYHKVDGVVCGREIHVETTWQHDGEVTT